MRLLHQQRKSIISILQFKQFQIIIPKILMEKQQSMGQKMDQSEKQFRKQFDPSSESYHKGLQEVVPTGGDRVPESMPTMFPEGYTPNVPLEVVDYGEEYRQVENNRSVFQNLKKQLARLGPVVQAMLRHEDHFKTKGDPNNEKHFQTYQENISKEKQSLKAVQDTLIAFQPILSNMKQEGTQCSKQLTEIIQQSNKKHENKESLTDFNFRVKKLSTLTFSIAQKCLQQLKDIKKSHSSKQKVTGQSKQVAN